MHIRHEGKEISLDYKFENLESFEETFGKYYRFNECNVMEKFSNFRV